MKNKRLYMMMAGTAVLTGVSFNMPHTAQAGEHYGFTAHHEVPAKPYARQVRKLPGDEKLEVREYLNYEQREPCQNYRVPPEPFMHDDCARQEKPVPALRVIREEPPLTQNETTVTELRPIVARYTVYFDHDRFNIRDSERATLERVSQEIKDYAPYEVTIAGYADRSGAADYNLTLSQKRAQAISLALTSVGISNRILDQEAHGENDPAVPTADGVRLEENRRVEIQFRK